MSGKQFSLALSAFVLKAKGNADAVVRKTVLDVGTSLVMKSPVGDGSLWQTPPPKGYVGGRFRANWQYGNLTSGGIPMQPIPDIDPSGQVPVMRIMGQVPVKAAGKVHVFKNNLPYAQRLEEGHSSQAPSGMVALTVLEFQQIVATAAAGLKK